MVSFDRFREYIFFETSIASIYRPKRQVKVVARPELAHTPHEMSLRGNL